MKLIGYLHGLAAIREAIEEYQPEHGVVISDLIDLVRSHFSFQAYPVLQPGVIPPQSLVFAGGRYTHDNQTFAIIQLVMGPNSDVAAAVTTEQAELVLRELISILDDRLGYRLGTIEFAPRYLSNIVVEFADDLQKRMQQIASISDVINRYKPGFRRQFKLKHLGFGDNPDPANAALQQEPLGVIERSDFIIQRRVGEEFERHRYFCSAPMPTRDHMQALQEIEAVILGGSAPSPSSGGR